MSSRRARSNQFLPLCILVIGLAACKTDLGPPETTALKAPNVRPVVVSAPSQLTIYSRDNGRSYTLDVSARKVRFSTGQVLDLTDSQTNDMYAAFKNIIATDPVADSLGTLLYGDLGCHPKCITPYSLPKGGTQTLSGSSAERNGIQTSLMSSSQATGTLTMNFSETGTTSSLIIPDAALGDPCKDIVTSAALAKLNYTSRRTRILDEAVAVGLVEGGNAVAEFVFPPFTLAAAELGTLMLENQTTSVQVNIMAFYWNSYSCGTRQIISAPIYHSAPSGLGNGIWVCHNMSAWISFDSGKNWTSVQVNICEEQTD